MCLELFARKHVFEVQKNERKHVFAVIAEAPSSKSTSGSRLANKHTKNMCLQLFVQTG